MKLAIQVQIVDKAVCVSLCTDALKKEKSIFFFPPTMGKY